MITAKRILYDVERCIKKGWCQGTSMKSRDGVPLDMHLIRDYNIVPQCFCLAGAVSYSVTWDYNPAYTEAINALCRAIARITKKRIRNFDHLVAWNDSPRRTKKQVLRVVVMAREILRHKK